MTKGMEVVAIIQARMGSTRLPGKVLRDIGGRTMLARVVRRAARATRLDGLVVATTTESRDDVIVEECKCLEVPWFRGSANDVLNRYHQIAQARDIPAVVRITSDCPLIDPEVIDEIVHVFLGGGWDYVSNTLEPRSFPLGLDVEVFTFAALRRAWEEDDNRAWREHVTPYLYRHPDLFRLKGVRPDEDFSDMRWTVDTAQDLELVRRIYAGFDGDDHFTWREVLALLKNHPEWIAINRDVPQKTVD